MTEPIQTPVVDTRKKNALTKYEIANFAGEETAPEDGYLRLAKWIPTINNESEDIVNEEGFYDGDGTPEENVDGTKEKYSIEGMFDSKDPAMALVASKKDETGDGRKVWLKVTDPDGATEVGLATISNIKFRGGLATDFAPFTCMISRNEKPVKTPAV